MTPSAARECRPASPRQPAPRRKRPVPSCLLFNFDAIGAVDRELPSYSPAGFRPRLAVFGAFHPLWGRSANQSKGSHARKLVVRSKEGGVYGPRYWCEPLWHCAQRHGRELREPGRYGAIALIEDPGIMQRIIEHLWLWAPLGSASWPR